MGKLLHQGGNWRRKSGSDPKEAYSLGRVAKLCHSGASEEKQCVQKVHILMHDC